MSRFYFLIKIVTFLFLNVSFSQEIKGRVYFEGKPLPSVNIKINGTTNGTSSDANGKFKILVKIGDTLNFSYVGKQIQKIQIKNYKPLRINMKSRVNELQEIVLQGKDKQLLESRKIITRFGEIDMDKAGYTSYGYTGQEIQSFSAIGIPEALVGRVPNLQLTDQGIILRPRGFFEKYALWDIDGILYDGIPPYFDPAKVKSVFVIPSTTSSLSYGSRAAGGVIIVNTYKYFKNKTSLKQLDYFVNNDNDLHSVNDKELSRIVKLNDSNIDSLRFIAFKYEQENNGIFSLKINRYILSKNFYDIKSYRDVAESLIHQRQYTNAWNNYLEFLKKENYKINDLELKIIINDMERLYHAYRLKRKNKNFSSSKKLTDDLKNEVRLIFEWTVPNESLVIEIINPKKQIVKFSLGNNSDENTKIEEVFIDGNILGEWTLNIKTKEDFTLNGNLKVTTYKDWLSNNSTKPEKRVFFFRKTKEGYFKLFNLSI